MMRLICFVAMILFGSIVSRAAEPEKTDLFTADEGGYAAYRIPALVVTAKGSILAACEARRDSAGDWGNIDLLLRRSSDGGKTWSAATKIVSAPADVKRNPAAEKLNIGKPGDVGVTNPVLIADRGGAVHLLYCVNYFRCFHARSDDDGQTFTPAKEITATFEPLRSAYAWQVLATGPGHGIQLKSGRLITPIWISLGQGRSGHSPSTSGTIYSDDGGETWLAGELIQSGKLESSSEVSIAELSDGRVMMNARHVGEPHLRAVLVSPDGTGKWSEPKFDAALPEPVCMGSLLSVEGDDGKHALLFSNPHNADGRERKNLTVKISRDDGATWSVLQTLEPGASAYSDLAAGVDGTIYCFYERGRASQPAAGPAALTIAKW
jgi:sialidase-1